MPPLLRKIALAWMLLWLPLSGVMASTLPFCGQGMNGWLAMQRPAAAAASAQPADAEAMPPCHQPEAAAPLALDAAAAEQAPLPGEHCSLCHLAGAIALPVMPQVPQIAGASPVEVSPPSSFHSWLGEPLQPPPLSTPA